jgi:hypothetical protein
MKQNSAKSAAMRGGKQIGESLAEPECNEAWRNLLGVLPFGDKFDDLNEPLPWDASLIQDMSIVGILGEVDTILP